MRLVLLLLAGMIALAVAHDRAVAAVPSGIAAALAAEVAAGRSIEPICRGCGCRGGPGHRLSNGKCASWGRRR